MKLIRGASRTMALALALLAPAARAGEISCGTTTPAAAGTCAAGEIPNNVAEDAGRATAEGVPQGGAGFGESSALEAALGLLRAAGLLP